MDFTDSKDNASSTLLLENKNLTSINFTENFDTEVNNNVTTEQPRNLTTATIPPLQEFDFLNPIWNVAFSATVFTGTVGNLIVLWIVLGEYMIFFYLKFS